jgi:hypothetical protein
MQDAVTGSFPTRLRVASDNRSGDYRFYYDDRKTIDFRSYVSGTTGVSMPVGLHSDNPVLFSTTQSGTTVRNVEMNTNIVISGIVRKGVGDYFTTPIPGQDFTPFRDDCNPAVEGKFYLSGGVPNPFFAVGSKVSDVGEGFDQPLWSKSKIEIDLTPTASHSFFIQNNLSSSNNFPMAYWNKTRKMWEGIGSGREFANYAAGTTSSYQAFCEEQCLGFGIGLNQAISGAFDDRAGNKISNFGFPFHVKYHATSSNTIAVSSYTRVPFLVEKIVLEWSGSMIYNNTYDKDFTNYSVCTFFILNQRKPFSYTDAAVQQFVARTSDGHTQFITTGANIPASYNGGTVVTTIRDLVTCAQVVCFTNLADSETTRLAGRELSIFPGSTFSPAGEGSWSGRFVMSGVVKNALPNEGSDQIQVGISDSGLRTMSLINKHSTRSGLFTPSGRDFVGALEKGSEVVRVISTFLSSTFTGSQDPTGSLVTLSRYYKTNPYLLMPGDELVFGWQLPMSNRINSAFGKEQYAGKGTEMFFAPVPSKITLFGSTIQEGREQHDTLNQLLTSPGIHEVIG